MKKTKKRTVKKKEIKQEEYLDLRPKPQMAPIFNEDKFNLDMAIALKALQISQRMIHEMFNPKKPETEEQRKTRMTIENSALDNKRRPTFALEAYKESLDNGNTRL